MDLGIAGRVALVTASSKGLGRGAAVALAAEGVKVVLCARGREPLAETAAAIAEAGGEALAVQADVTEPSQPAALVAAAVRHFGRLDIVVANAGGPTPATALDVTADAVHEAIEANFLTSVRLVQAAVPHMRADGWGRICCITSFGVKHTDPGAGAVEHSPHGAVGLGQDGGGRPLRRRHHPEPAVPGPARHRPGQATRAGGGRWAVGRPRRLRAHRRLPLLRARQVRHRHRPPSGRRHRHRAPVDG